MYSNLNDTNSGIRSKVVRSLGKMAKYGHFNIQERERFKKLCSNILGKDDDFDWDRAYVVRKEAEEALKYV